MTEFACYIIVQPENRYITELLKNMRCAILMSGTGSNAVALLEYERRTAACPYHVAALITDAPESSNTRSIAERYGLPWAECDIRRFYAEHGESTTRMDSPERCRLRNLWSSELLKTVKQFEVDFLLFAGFVSLTNLAAEIPCLNVHPGDLTRCGENGERLYAGLHVLPVEKALLNGDKYLRSSVILVQPYTGDGSKDVDCGPIIGVSEPVAVDLGQYTVGDLRRIKAARVPGVKCSDALRSIALEHIERLKVAGDHVVFPRAAADFAAGAFSFDGSELYYRGTGVVSVEYSADSPAVPISCEK